MKNVNREGIINPFSVALVNHFVVIAVFNPFLPMLTFQKSEKPIKEPIHYLIAVRLFQPRNTLKDVICFDFYQKKRQLVIHFHKKLKFHLADFIHIKSRYLHLNMRQSYHRQHVDSKSVKTNCFHFFQYLPVSVLPLFCSF